MSNAEASKSPRAGQVVTFYSFKGGTGRTMALANVAWILAANGRRVLVADWDLESPGLHRFFQPFMDASVSERPGIIDFIRKWEWAAVGAEIDPDALHTGIEGSRKAAEQDLSRLIHEHIDEARRYAIPLSWAFPGQGALHFWTSGKQANGAYQAALSALDWDNFYDNLYGGQFFDALRQYMKSSYDYVLIDSRTGLSDIADICTVHLPDIVVDCFTLSTQGIEGAATIARMIEGSTKRNIAILPVPMRIDRRQKEKVEEGLGFAAQLFEGLPAGMSDAQRGEYWAEVEVPYRSSYACEEILAVFGDAPGSRTSLLASYERIAARITAGAITASPPRDEWLRLRTRNLFSRTPPSSPVEVVLDFSPVDQLWAEWIAAILAGAEINVRWSGETPAGVAGPDDAELSTQTVAIVTDSYISRLMDGPPAVHPDLLICVTDIRLPQQLAEIQVLFLARLSEDQVVSLLIDRFDGRLPADSESGSPALPYPGGNRPQIVNMPGRNANFTGRDQDLRRLRDELRAGGVTVVLPLTIRGLGGVGKTQVALEYAHRFRADYDIIWWMNCGQSQYVDASLADLAQEMRSVFQADVPEEGGVTEVAQQVLNFLKEKFADKRWLLIYDNAEDIDEVADLLPDSGGHVLITSRNEAWIGKGNSLKVDVFKRHESISHLRKRMPAITEAEANELAKVLGDMPLAVAAAGAMLASTQMSVADYLQQLRQQPTRTFPAGDPLNEYPEAATRAWELSLTHLQQRSAAAARLLELCSVMAPDISLDLIVTQAMARTLRDLDPTISDRTMISRLIRQIDVLALIKLDNNARQIQVHRVVQAIVYERMSEANQERARQSVHQLVVAARPPEGDVDDPETWPRFRLIWPHLSPSGAMWSEDEQVRDLLIERVRYLWQRDDLERGQRRAVEIQGAWRTMLAGGPEPEMAESLQRQLFRLQFNLANILRDLALFQDARTVDEAVLRGQTKYLPALHPHTLQTRGSLAADLRALGYYHDALGYDLETYQLWNNEYGDDYRGTLTAAHNLGLSYLLTGDFRNALDYDLRTLERRTAVLSAEHPRTLNSGASVARDLLEAGRYVDAVRQSDAVWAQCREILGHDARTTLNARLALGVAHRCAGRLDEAARHIDAARVGLVRGFGSESSDALACRLSQALTLLAMHQVPRGMRAAEEVLAVYEGRVGADHPHALICTLNIATAAYLEKDYDVAGSRIRSAVEGLEARVGAAHPYTLAAKMVQATVLAHRGSLTEAAELEEVVASGRERVLGPQHPDTLRCRANLLLTLQALGVDGSREREAVIAELAAMVGDEHPDVAAAGAGERLLCMIDPQPF